MEILDLLEERVQALLLQIQSLREENGTLRDELLKSQAAAEESRQAFQDLAAERHLREEISLRLEALADRIQDSLPAE